MRQMNAIVGTQYGLQGYPKTVSNTKKRRLLLTPYTLTIVSHDFLVPPTVTVYPFHNAWTPADSSNR